MMIIHGLSTFPRLVVGIYGVVSYAVGHRRREMGLRLALGAQRRQVLALFVTHAFGLVAV